MNYRYSEKNEKEKKIKWKKSHIGLAIYPLHSLEKPSHKTQ